MIPDCVLPPNLIEAVFRINVLKSSHTLCFRHSSFRLKASICIIRYASLRRSSLLCRKGVKVPNHFPTHNIAKATLIPRQRDQRTCFIKLTCRRRSASGRCKHLRGAAGPAWGSEVLATMLGSAQAFFSHAESKVGLTKTFDEFS